MVRGNTRERTDDFDPESEQVRRVMSDDVGQRQSRGRLIFAGSMCLCGIALVFLIGGSAAFSFLPFIVGTLLAGVAFASAAFTLLRLNRASAVMTIGMITVLGLMTWFPSPWSTGQITWLFGCLSGGVFGAHFRHRIAAGRADDTP